MLRPAVATKKIPWGKLCYLTAFADRILVRFKKSIMTPQGGPGGIRGDAGGPRLNQTVTHFVVFEFPELHSWA